MDILILTALGSQEFQYISQESQAVFVAGVLPAYTTELQDELRTTDRETTEGGIKPQ